MPSYEYALHAHLVMGTVLAVAPSCLHGAPTERWTAATALQYAHTRPLPDGGTLVVERRPAGSQGPFSLWRRFRYGPTRALEPKLDAIIADLDAMLASWSPQVLRKRKHARLLGAAEDLARTLARHHLGLSRLTEPQRAGADLLAAGRLARWERAILGRPPSR